MKKKTIYRLIFITLLPVAAIAGNLSAGRPDLTEKVYSMGFFRFISVIFSNISGILPFSLIEALAWLALGVFVFAVIKIIKTGKKKRKKKTQKKPQKRTGVLDLALTAAAAAGVFYFIYVLSWGLAYNRNDAFSIFGLHKKETGLSELMLVGESLRDELNQLSEELGEDPFEIKKVIDRGSIGYYRVQEKYPELGGNYPEAKPVKFSLLLSYLQIWGFYSPFTFEANINTMVPGSMLPSTIAHELAHMRGFAREDEANYIAYLVCVNHNDPAYVYSGNLLAFINIASAVRRTDRGAYDSLFSGLDPPVKAHIKEINEFNAKYSGLFDELSSKINDLFLKSNRQTDGVLSYGRMVDLLVADFLSD